MKDSAEGVRKTIAYDLINSQGFDQYLGIVPKVSRTIGTGADALIL